MRVCLVNAPVLIVREPWYDTPDFPRTALAYLAGQLLRNGFGDVSVIDVKFERLGFEECIDRIVNLRPDVVGFTAFTNEIKPCAYLAARIKERLKDVVTVIGGCMLPPSLSRP